MSYRLDLARATGKIILGITPSILPQSTLTVAANPGDQSLTLASTAGFFPGTVVSLWDGTDEKFMLVGPQSLITPTNLPLDFTGQAAGLSLAHGIGATVCTNLLDVPPQATGPMLFGSYPVISCFVLDDTADIGGTSFWRPIELLRIVYQLPATQSANPKMNSQIFLRQQVVRAEKETDLIQTTLINNPRFLAYNRRNATMLLKYAKTLRREESNPDAPRFQVTLDCQVRAVEQIMSGPAP